MTRWMITAQYQELQRFHNSDAAIFMGMDKTVLIESGRNMCCIMPWCARSCKPDVLDTQQQSCTCMRFVIQFKLLWAPHDPILGKVYHRCIYKNIILSINAFVRVYVKLLCHWLHSRVDHAWLCAVQSLTTLTGIRPNIDGNPQLTDISGLLTLAQANGCTADATPPLDVNIVVSLAPANGFCTLNSYKRVCDYIQLGATAVGCAWNWNRDKGTLRWCNYQVFSKILVMHIVWHPFSV